MIGLILFVIVFLVLLAYLVGMYNRLVFLKTGVDQSWANIDVILKQRHDEIPKLVSVCEGYMQYEKKLLENITALRSQAMGARSVNEKIRSEEKLASALGGLFAVIENYPDLKANQNFLNLQKRVSYLEEQLADRRELYNSSTTIYNTRIQQIPYNYIATYAHFEQMDLFKVSAADKKDVDIKFNMP